MPYRPAYLRRHHQATLRHELTQIHDDLAALDRGVAEAAAMANRAQSRVNALGNGLREAHKFANTPEGCGPECGDPGSTPEALAAGIVGPGKKPADDDGQVRDGIRADGLPADHPESMDLELSPEHEGMLAAYANDMWPADEYAEITAEDWQERGGAS